MILFDFSEFALYQIEQEFEQHFANVEIACLVGDVKDTSALERVFASYRPSVVFRTAAYKHVPLMEREKAAARSSTQQRVLVQCLAEGYL